MMDKVSFIFGIVGIATVAGAYMPTFCQKQDDVFQTTANTVLRSLAKTGRSTVSAEYCRTIVHYSDTAYDTMVTCPELMEDEPLRHVWRIIDQQIANLCPQYERKLECSLQVVTDLNEHCNQIVSPVQVDTDQTQICQLGAEYMECLENMTAMCSGSSELLTVNVPAALNSMRSIVGSLACNGTEGMQMDVASDGSAPVLPAQGQGEHGCTVDMANREMATCNRNFEMARNGNYNDENGCRAKTEYLDCVDRVVMNCPTIVVSETVSIIRADFHANCLHSLNTCAPEVLDGSMTVTAFCATLSEGARTRCSWLRTAANCFSRLRDFCPVARESDRHQADRIAAETDRMILEYNC